MRDLTRVGLLVFACSCGTGVSPAVSGEPRDVATIPWAPEPEVELGGGGGIGGYWSPCEVADCNERGLDKDYVDPARAGGDQP
jgi:hypothetical protein